jgi:hypothetical protein
MKRFPNFWVFVASTLVGLALSYIVTIVVWNLVIEHRAFHCTDDMGFALVVQSIDDHRLAGDTLGPGWTWDGVKAARLIYLAAFYSLWFLLATGPRWTVLRKNSHESVA